MVSSPLPVSLPAECRKAAKSFASFADPSDGLDKVIPVSVLRRAKGFCILTVVKAGFLFSARAGSGIVIARLPDGTWSAPSACGVAGLGAGLQVGAEMAEFIIILNSRAAVKSFQAAGSLTLGGNMSIAAGPLGRNIEATGSLSSKGKVAAMYSYSRSKGLFGGVSAEGSVVVERSDANSKAYGRPVTATELLSGQVDLPEFADHLIETIQRRTGNVTEWIEHDDDDESELDGRRGARTRDRSQSDPMGRGYEFGSSYARGGSEAPVGRGTISSKARNALGALGGRSRSKSGSNSNLPTVSQGARFEQDFGDSYDFNRVEENDDKDERDVGYRRENVGNVAGKRTPTKSEKSRLTKPRSGSGGLKELAEGMTWGKSPKGRDTRDSFDSLDDDPSGGMLRFQSAASSETEYYGQEEIESRKRRATVGSSSHHTTPQRFHTPKPSSTSTADPFSDQPSHDKPYSTKPWDSEEEDFIRSKATSRPSGATTPSRVILSPHVNKGDPFDFSEVEMDFASIANNPRGGYTPADSTSVNKTRARAATVGKGIGVGIALFDFNGVEEGDLAFKKGDVITILKQDDEEWLSGRLKFKEGIFPKNYIEVHLD